MAANDATVSPSCRRVIASYERDIASLEGADYCASLIACERGENPLGGKRKVLDADARGGGERIRNGGRDPHKCGVAPPLCAKRAPRPPLFHNCRHDLEGDNEGPPDFVIPQGWSGWSAGVSRPVP